MSKIVYDEVYYIDREISDLKIQKESYEDNIKNKRGHIESIKTILTHINNRIERLIIKKSEIIDKI